ncbi:transposase IS3/IS911 family protein [Bacteroides coprosuis DSM 18011]|uniref:Transposase IS3/IS911 family protein n=1 Tax=Bacteroides coprosuis DSM 18011 TaxID=679937 RepID=F3ZQ92_9BACE|nr:transposase [Bacteroides coprosuis]EGJ70857.1 transposase IS3/IS911 family protein [Bacteroides coprosuis DSM 18011]EGJ71758.1 transposase IS3/IS911 family protein [Bacteroides coprosuis DSM 18011]
MKSKKMNRYTDSERLSILRDHFETGSSRASTARKYNLATPSLINSWINRFRFEELELSSDCKYSQEMKKKQETTSTESSLQSRIRDLEKALAYSKLEVLALNTLIDIAEKQEEITIRKKSGAKQ